ncbi:MAG: glycosyl transferase [Candidatus Competibacteraceae bacterium]|nr:glycosyl transferase [Candidatus Competibacteraceae bacterium]
MNTEQPVRIFVGAHETELLAFKVLEYSIKRHTALAVEMRTVDNSLAPEPSDTRFLAYTNFSYGRFAIPKLMGYQGRAVYMDSDMLVFKDIAELWNTPFDGAKILVEKMSEASQGKGRLTAVMLMDCEALDWYPEQIIARLGNDYDYEQLMSIHPLLADGDLQDRLPLGWNSLDEVNEHTRLLHFTKIKTQPWVYPAHPWGQLWIDEVNLMLENGALSPELIKDEIAQGHVRPSLALELGLSDQHRSKTLSAKALANYDKQAGYVIHKKLFEAMAQRKQAKLDREQELDPIGFRKRQTRRRLRSFFAIPSNSC